MMRISTWLAAVARTLRQPRPRRTNARRLRPACEPLESREVPAIVITEVHPSGSGNGTYGADWFEVTNTGIVDVNIGGWNVDDNSNSFANAVALRGITTIPAGKSAVFFEGDATGTTDAAITAAFSTAWFGSATPPSGLLIGAYGGPSVGLSTGGDAVNLFDSAGNRVTGVSFGPATANLTFDNTDGLGSTTLPLPVISAKSVAGVNGAAFSANGPEIGSPGRFFTGVDLSTYIRVGRYDLPEPTRTTPPPGNLLAQEASAVTWNWDTDTLFITGDGGTSITQVSKTGQLIDTMTLAPGSSPQGTEFYDPEGLTYVGGGQFVMTEERDQNVVKFTYAAGTTLTRAQTQTVGLGAFVPNIGLEGLSWDPATGGFIIVKEIQPLGIFQSTVDFAAGTASNSSPTTDNAANNLFNPALVGTLDFADVFALSNLAGRNGRPSSGELLVLSQESGKIVNIDRSGSIISSLTIISDPGNPLAVPAQQHEGLTMDANGFIYVVSENGGGDFDHPQLWVYAPTSVPNLAPTAVTLSNTVASILENTSTVTRIKVADVTVADDGVGANFLSVSGTGAAIFEVDSTGLYIKAGTNLDYETKTSYTVHVAVDDPNVGLSPDAVTTDYTLQITDVLNEDPGNPTLYISEVAPWASGNSPLGADWFEVTNAGNSPVNLAGWKMDDNSNTFANAVALSGIASIAPGESVIFIETSSLVAKADQFRLLWGAPASLQIGAYSGSGVGLSTGGDAVNLYDSTGSLVANVTFGTSPGAAPFASFNNAAGANNSPVTALSKVGVNGAYAAGVEIASPGSVGRLFISEVAPWSSGNSPVGADWFEVTNSTTRAIDITGWKMDDSSGSFAAAVTLNGITSIAPGESVIFLETATPAATAATFRSTWFGAYPPAGLQVGSYTGGGVGLSTGGDGVNVYNAAGVLQASVTFGTSPAGPLFPSFDNAAAKNNTALSLLSSAGANGAFIAWNDALEIGSPGTINNHAPTAAADSANVDEDGTVTIAVLGNDRDADLDGLVISATGPAGYGSVVESGGKLIYTPATNFNGNDSFTYTITDLRGGKATETVSITVAPVNDAPSADAVSVSTNEDTAIAVSLGGSDVETAEADLVFTVIRAPDHGTLSSNGANLIYTPAENYNGPDSFEYTVTDGGDGTSPAITSEAATVSITVVAVADQPNLAVSPAIGIQGSSISLSIAASLVDVDGSESLSIVVSGVPAGASLSAGTNLGGGSWLLAPSQLSGLKLNGAPAGPFSLTVAATATESSNASAASRSASLPVSVAGASFTDGVLTVYGTNNNDQVILDKEGNKIRVYTSFLPGSQAFTLNSVSRIVVFLGDGNDAVCVDDNIKVPAYLDGGSGNDLIDAGGGTSILLGGSGNDLLVGGKERDILIGGAGIDILASRGDEDILIGASTTWDANPAALLGLQAEWTRTDLKQPARMAHIRSGGGLNGSAVLTAATVIDDDATDLLFGGSGSDWYWVDLNEDIIFGKKKSETVN